MLPRAIATALQLPKLSGEMFIATKFTTSDEKAKLGNHLLRFIAEDFPPSMWTNVFYNQLHNTFGNIALYNSACFWNNYFETTNDQIEFLQNIVRFPCWGSPRFTYCDVEKQIRTGVVNSSIIAWKKRRLADERKKRDLAELARLKSIYEADSASAITALPAAIEPAMIQTDLLSWRSAGTRQADLAIRKGKVSAGLPAGVDAAPGRMAMIECYRRPGYIEDRLSQLTTLMQQGRALGATHISWG